MAMSWERLLSNRRFRDDETPRAREDGRSEFQKDYDRIVFSRAFRRLQGKTQVHPIPQNDHIHTRLTHTLEVTSVGRSLGVRAGMRLKSEGRLPREIIPEDVGSIVQAACLAHDIGNPPFGHAGEFAIRGWFKRNQGYIADLGDDEKLDFEYFEGNAQGLRVVTQLEGRLFEGGLRPTFATLGTLIKYPWASTKAIGMINKKFGYFKAEKDIANEIFEELGVVQKDSSSWARHPLVLLMEAADDICYAIVDLEDGVEMDLIDFDRVEEILKNGLTDDEWSQYDTIVDSVHRRAAFLRGKVVDYLIDEMIATFFKNETEILEGSFSQSLLDRCGQKAMDLISQSKKLASKDIFSDRRKTQIEIGAYSIIDVLLHELCDANIEYRKNKPSFKAERVFSLLGIDAPKPENDLYTSLLRITDFVSGMTDQSAVRLSRQLNGSGFMTVL
jgi:dGTPase